MYKTKDFVLASVLLANGFNLIGSDKKDGFSTIFFIFNTKENENLKEKILNDFINQECYINVKKFTWANKIIRQEMDKYK